MEKKNERVAFRSSITWYERSDALLVIWLSRRIGGRGSGGSVIDNG